MDQRASYSHSHHGRQEQQAPPQPRRSSAPKMAGTHSSLQEYGPDGTSTTDEAAAERVGVQYP